MTTTCTTCATVFRAERDEDGQAEIPGRKCADLTCDTWICDAACTEHLSFVCDGCGRRFCPAHRVAVDDLNCCPACVADCETLIGLPEVA